MISIAKKLFDPYSHGGNNLLPFWKQISQPQFESHRDALVTVMKYNEKKNVTQANVDEFVFLKISTP